MFNFFKRQKKKKDFDAYEDDYENDFNDNDEDTYSPRFPNVHWTCDHCGAYLNDQYGFDDNKYIWKCTECGRKSSISSDNIIYD